VDAVRAQGRRWGVALAAVLALAGPANAQTAALPAPTPDSPWPSRWEWVAAGGAVLGSFLLDAEGRDELYQERPSGVHGLERVGNRFGNPVVSAALVGGAYGAGILLDRPGLARGASRVGMGLIATGLATQVLKSAVGRPRPYLDSADGDELRPVSFSNDYMAWPSGHASTAFSLATGIAMESHNRWIGAAAYGAAGLTAWSRVYDDKHWTSDVVAGAVIGTLVTRATIRWLDARESGGSAPALAIGPDGVALTFAVP
jgi:membrane-associated phospholipid phosphatase